MQTEETQKVELPLVTPAEVNTKHISILLIEDGLRQVEVNLKEQEDNIGKLSEQLQRLQAMRIATTAQQNLLNELLRKITELESSQAGQ